MARLHWAIWLKSSTYHLDSNEEILIITEFDCLQVGAVRNKLSKIYAWIPRLHFYSILIYTVVVAGDG